MRQLAGAVSVVSVGEGAHRTGFTATSVTSLSIDPPSLLVSLNRNSASWPIVQRYRRFTVNILSSAHRQIAETFAGRRGLRGAERYADARWQQHGQAPALIDALAVIECDLDEAIERHSHAILIGRVLSVSHRTGVDPLVYWQGDYRRLDTDADDQ
ncbi:flavin reductase [Devosia limi DSM 17137]|uniref:Flavin reductase n=1 Tax=Devosia limi DSM 17137 TaxID=1121477 RepID=A0A0F5LEK8_9HYPH|nr:flavin reductase [Devosia limi DSM 17137]SHE49484.1 NADH-FMN oxidoreductase RutF, flavin reductase (DIM6/NTAB) family [Devosia limi DSM 17137]